MQLCKPSRRQLLIAIAAIGTSRLLVACSARTTAEAAQDIEEAAVPTCEPCTLRVMSTIAEEHIQNAQMVLNNEFTTQYPQIQVAVETVLAEWTEKLEAQMMAGEAPAIFAAGSSSFFRWLEVDLVLDVQAFVERDLSQEEIADYYDFQWAGLLVRGKRVGMPQYINLMTVCVNVDLFDQYDIDLPPADGEWTHEDYADLAQRLTEAARKAGNESFWGGWKPMWLFGRFWNTLSMFGGEVVDEKYGKQCQLDTAESQAALQWAYDLIWTHNDWARSAQLKNLGGHDAIAANLIGYAEDGTYPLRMGRLFAESNVRWDLRHMPRGPTGIRKTFGTTDAWLITKQTPFREEAWQVMRFLSGPTYQDQQVVAHEGLIPVLKSRLSAAIETMRQIQPSVAQVRLETIQEVLDWGYAEDTFWFHKQYAAYKIIDPTLKKVFRDGAAGPELFQEITQQVNKSQQW